MRLVTEIERRIDGQALYDYYPDEGPLRRELYGKHLEFLNAGSEFSERCMLAANRVGKTEGVGGYECVLHATGLYPHWWQGRRFDGPVEVWASGDTSKTGRDIIQAKLLGPPGQPEKEGTGLIPAEKIKRTTVKQGIADAIETIYVKHVSGGTSTIQIKSYDQRREAFQGTAKDVIWLDEEPPLDIYVECLLRTMTTGGLIMCTFTPLEGMSETVMEYLPDGKIQEMHEGNKLLVMATWDDAPHLSKDMKDAMYKSIPSYQRDARSKGIPQLGSGAIYPVPESEITIEPFEIPAHWPRCYGLDVGWICTSAVHMAWDREADIVYIYHVYHQGEAEPATHIHGINAPGAWIPGTIDPAARGRSQKDGDRLIQDYRDLGLNIQAALNAREAGIYQVWLRLSSGKLKIFSTCATWFAEYRLYRRDDKGKVVKDKDHDMDATRYGIVSGLDLAQVFRPAVDEPDYFPTEFG